MNIPLLPTLSTAFIVLSAVTVGIGWYLIKQKKIDAHKRAMTTAAVFALIFFVIYMSRTIFIGNTSFGGPDDVKLYYTIFLIFHITLATIGSVFGIVTLYLGFKNNITKHRRSEERCVVKEISITVYQVLHRMFRYGVGLTTPAI